MNKTINVSVLGAAGVGKTSCLISMLDNLKTSFFENTNLQFAIDSTARKLIIDERKKLVNCLEKGTVEHSNGIRPTAKITKYHLGLGKRGEKFPLPYNIEFTDHPGSWLTSGNVNELNHIKDLVANSKVLIIPIDSASLMELDNDIQVKSLLSVLTDVYSNLSDPRLVILAPMKSEKYFVAEGPNLSNRPYYELVKKVQDKYENIITFLTSKSLKRNVSVVISPVQTLGSCKLMYFNSSDESSSKEVPVFVVTQRGVYAPQHTERPLTYLLSFILKNQYDIASQGFRGMIRNLSGELNYLNASSEELSQLCMDYDGVKIVQNSGITNF
jgi:hypothetical protein